MRQFLSIKIAIFFLSQLCQSSSIYYNVQLQNNTETQQFKLIDEIISQQFAIGLWSQCVPQLQASFQFSNQQNIEPLISIEKQFLFLLKNHVKEEELLIYFAEFDQEQVLNKIILKADQFQTSEIFQSFDSLDYEGKWVFLLLNFNLQESSLIIIFNETSINKIRFTQNLKDITVIFGGSYKAQNFNQDNNQVFSYYKGRISKPFIIDLSNNQELNFSELKYKSLIRTKQQRENEVYYFYSELAVIDENTQFMLQKSIPQNGNGYSMSGWAKNFHKYYSFQAQIFLFRITTNNFYGNVSYEGDHVLKYSYLIDPSGNDDTMIMLSADLHKIPIFDVVGKYSKRFEKRTQPNVSRLVYDGIHQWHYFKYEYQKENNQGTGKMEIHFQNDLGVYKIEFGDDGYNGSFLNSDFIFSVGEDIFPSYRFNGQIYQLMFINNFNDPTINDFQKCHFRCLTCDGPFENSCLQCKQNSNRIYMEEIRQCICRQGYIENNIVDCLEFFHNRNEIQVFLNNASILCDLGYFQKPVYFNQYICQKCPTSSSNQYYCLECITNPNEWYKHPYCATKLSQKYFIANNSYNFNQYRTINFDINNDFELVMKPDPINGAKDSYSTSQCDETCLKCESNICLICKQNIEKGRRAVAIGGACIQCPYNCDICLPRNEIQISQINQMFSNSFFKFYSNICLHSFNDQEYYYDRQLQTFTQCKETQFSCQNSYQIVLNLYCSTEEYNTNLYELTDKEQYYFKQQNIVFEQLNQLHEVFENQFYEQANKDSIRIIELVIVSSRSQICKQKQSIQIQNEFSTNIFSALNVSLSIKFQQEVIFELQNNLIFKNFQSIHIEGLHFKICQNTFSQLIVFEGIFLQQIEFQNVNFTLEYASNNLTLIAIQNTTLVTVQMISILSEQVQSNFIFLSIQPTNQKQIINFKNILFKNFKCFNWTLLQFKQNQKIDINLSNLYIFNSKLENFVIVDNIDLCLQDKKYCTEKDFIELEADTILNVDNFLFEQSILFGRLTLNNSKSILNGHLFFSSKIHNFNVLNCKIFNAKVLQIGQNSNLKNFLIINCLFQFESLFIFTDQTQASSAQQFLDNFTFTGNEYSKQTKFVYLQKSNSIATNCTIYNLQIKNNVLSISENVSDIYSIDLSLFYISAQIVEIKNLLIFRSLGINIISLAFVSQLTLINTTITQLEEFRYLKIQNLFFCLKQMDNQKIQGTSIQMFSIDQILFENLTISQVQSLNSPIILYQSANPEKVIQQETIVFSNLFVDQSFSLVENKESLVSVISINTVQESEISIIGSEFRENILHHHQETVEQQGQLVSILATRSKCKIEKSNFTQNLVLNSSNSINHLQCKDIVIQESVFEKNSIFSQELFQNKIFEDFANLSVIRIKSLAGNAILKFNTLLITKVNISLSQGIQSAAFSLFAQNVNQVKISNVNFLDLEIIYDSEFQKAGAIYIDCTESLSIKIDVNNIRANNFFSFAQGGLFYIENAKNHAELEFNDIQAVDYFSVIGSLIFIQFNLNQEVEQRIKIIKIISYCTKSGWIKFTQNFIQKQALQNEIVLSNQRNISLVDRYQIYIEFGSLIELNNITFYGLIQESAFFFQNITKLDIYSAHLFNSSVQKYLIQINFLSVISSNTETQKNQSLQIYNMQIFDIIFSSINVNIYCDFEVKQIITICVTKSDELLNNLDTQNKTERCNTKEMVVLTQSGILQILSQQSQLFDMKINMLNFKNIYCLQCQNGLLLIYLNNYGSQQYVLQNIMLQSSICGQLGCINIIKQDQQTIIQEDNLKNEKQQELLFQNYVCTNNSATNGTCLFFQNIDIKISESYFLLNNAILAGGAIYVASINQFVIENSVISENTAFFGGGIYLNKSYPLLYEKLNVSIIQNQAFFSGQNVYSSAEKLLIIYGYFAQSIELLEANQTDEYQIEKYGIKGQNEIFGVETETLFYPNGQNISLYKYFDWRNRKYILPNLKFRLQAVTLKSVTVSELQNQYCTIQARPTKNQTLEFSTNYTNIQNIYYDEITNDFNLDNLAIYFQNQDGIELQFNCSCIKVPIYSQSYPYKIIKYLNYLFKIEFRPLECQLGEIVNLITNSCEVCDSDQGFFNLQPKETECRMKDDASTISVTPAQLQIRKNYWRPYFDTFEISYCINLPINCKGGWIEGDSSCNDGHLGALCEQCDIYNIRGDGKFSRKSQFLCSPCQGENQNIIIIIILCIETLASILIAAQSNYTSVQEQLLIIRMKLLGFKVFFKINQRSILIKMFTNYLQIIGYISTFQLQFSFDLDTIITFAANPTKQLTYTLNCWLSNSFQLEIHYLNMICQLLLPFCYIIIFFILYFFGSLINYLNYSKSLIIATLIYIYIYFQPTLVGSLVQLLSFRDISGFQWIAANVAYRYDLKDHYYWIYQLFLPALIFISIFIPFYFIYSLLKNQNKLNTKEVRLKWGFLYTEYNQNAYLWEVLKIFQKELLIAFLSYFEDNITLKSVFVSLILLSYLELNIIYKPYYSSSLNQLDSQSTNVCFISILLALGTNYCQKFQNYFFALLFSSCLLIMNIHFMLLILSSIIYHYFFNKTSKASQNLSYVTSFLKYFPRLQKIKFFQRFILKNQSIRTLRLDNLFKKLKQFAVCIAKQKVDESDWNLRFRMLRIVSEQKSSNKLIQKEFEK